MSDTAAQLAAMVDGDERAARAREAVGGRYFDGRAGVGAAHVSRDRVPRDPKESLTTTTSVKSATTEDTEVKRRTRV